MDKLIVFIAPILLLANTALAQQSPSGTVAGGMTNDVPDTVLSAVAIDTAETLEGARTQALGRAMGKVMRFHDVHSGLLETDVTTARYEETYSIQTTVLSEKLEDGRFVAWVRCVARHVRNSYAATIKPRQPTADR